MCWHKYPQQWVDGYRSPNTGMTWLQYKRCLKCRKLKERMV